MPELPEVETVVRGLNKLIINKTISSAKTDNFKSFPVKEQDIAKFIIGSSIKLVHRRAKIIIIDLSSGYSLLVHLKMTGQLVFKGNEEAWGAGHPSNSLVDKLPDKSTRLIVVFTSAEKLFFNDQRKFGWVKLFKTNELSELVTLTKLGPEPLGAEFSEELFITNVLRRKKSPIKAVLLDQTILSGVGNIYADEALFAAQIRPTSLAGKIPKYRLKILRQKIIEVLRLSLDKGGSTSKNYVNAEGKKGNYLDFAAVYGRTNLACLVCAQPITKIRVAGRGTHICLKCQKKY